MSSTKNRNDRLNRERAITTALSTMDSSLGECVLNTNVKENRRLQSELAKLSIEHKKIKSRMDSSKNLFVKKSALYKYEPMILIKREIDMKAYGIADDRKTPGYMKPIGCRSRTPSSLSTTLDAFCLKRSHTMNLWEETYSRTQPSEFQSPIRPVSRLSETEKNKLSVWRKLHKIDPELHSSSKSLPCKINIRSKLTKLRLENVYSKTLAYSDDTYSPPCSESNRNSESRLKITII